VTITNRGPAPVGGWVLVLVLPRTALAVTEVSGANASRDGTTWTFTPVAGAVVPAGGSVRVAFQVRGAPLVSAQPTSCRLDGSRCAGLDG
jgi:hypothetical protein